MIKSKKLIQPRASFSPIFDQWEKISYGPFTVTVDQQNPSYIHARFFVHGKEVKITPQQKEIMALLMAQDGQPLSAEQAASSIPESRKRFESGHTLKWQIFYIKRAINEQIGDSLKPKMLQAALNLIVTERNILPKTRGAKAPESYSIVGPYVFSRAMSEPSEEPSAPKKRLPSQLDLTGLFNKTDTLAYGPFKIVKPEGLSFQFSKFSVKDTIIHLPLAQKQIMAMLIDQQGRPLLRDNISGFLRDERYLTVSSNLMQVQICKIKKTITKELTPVFGAEAAKNVTKMIAPLALNKRSRQTGIENPQLVGAYRLRVIG